MRGAAVAALGRCAVPRRAASTAPPLTVYLNGRLVPITEATVSVDDRGWLFSDGVYEVTKVFGAGAGARPHVFTEGEHMARLARGLAELRFDAAAADAAVAEVRSATRALLDVNHLARGDACAYVYAQVSRGAAPRAHAFPRPPVRPTVYVAAKPYVPPPPAAFDGGLTAVTTPDTRWARCDIKTVSLLPNVLANSAAKDAGAHEALFVRGGGGGNLVEASHSNVFGVLDGVLVTHPLDNILPGITRSVILARARDAGVTAIEAPIPLARFGDLTELFVTATTTEIMPVRSRGGGTAPGAQRRGWWRCAAGGATCAAHPAADPRTSSPNPPLAPPLPSQIVSVDGRRVGNGKVGPITRKLRAAWPLWVRDDLEKATRVGQA